MAVETIGSALNTKSKRILAEFQFADSGAIKVGKFAPGVSGDLRISPNGIVARNESGIITFSIDGTTGNAADIAGDIVDVAMINSGVITKVLVDGTTILMASLLVASATDGHAALFTASTAVFALGKAFQPSTVAGDTILIFMGGSA